MLLGKFSLFYMAKQWKNNLDICSHCNTFFPQNNLFSTIKNENGKMQLEANIYFPKQCNFFEKAKISFSISRSYEDIKLNKMAGNLNAICRLQFAQQE